MEIMLREKLLAEDAQTKPVAVILAKNAIASKQDFAVLMDCFFSTEYRLAQRAAWIASHAVAMDQKFIFPYLTIMTGQLLKTDIPDAVVRNVLRILRLIDIPEENQGTVMNACFILAGKADAPVAVKAFSLSILKKLSLTYPEINEELKLIAQASLMNENAAVRNVAEKILKSLHKSKAPSINN